MSAFDLKVCTLAEVDALCAAYHGYGGAGGTATYAFGVYEGPKLVAAYAWQPPAPGAAKSVCLACPQGVLALSRMVAVPRAERALNHVSRPLKRQMKHLIDRTRWPVLVTYSDEGQGHTGHVYKCSGWRPTKRSKRTTYTDEHGVRCSPYRCGKTNHEGLTRGPDTFIQRWEHWITDNPAELMTRHWERVAVPGKVWRSGAQAFTYERSKTSLDDPLRPGSLAGCTCGISSIDWSGLAPTFRCAYHAPRRTGNERSHL